MVRLFRFLAYCLFFLLAVVYLLPKQNIYYLLEKQLQDYSVVISKEKVFESGVDLKISDALVSYESINIAKIKTVDVNFYIFYNEINIKNVDLSSVLDSFMPLHVDSMSIHYHIFNPLTIISTCRGAFGEAKIKFDIPNKSINVILKPSKKMINDYKQSLKEFEKFENGEYVYEKNI